MGSPLLFVYIIYTSILRGVGDSVTPLIALSLTSLIGLAVTPVLLKGYFGFPALGIVVPAVATIMGYAAVLIFLSFYLNYKNHPLKIDARLLKSIRHDSNLKQTDLKAWYPNRHPNGDDVIGRLSHYWFG